jgi:hypothetical protein
MDFCFLVPGICVAHALWIVAPRGSKNCFSLTVIIIIMNWFQSAQVSCYILELHLIYVILKIKMPCSICSSHLFFSSQGGGQPALHPVASGMIDFVAVHCLWNVEVKQVRLVNLCHIVFVL